MSIWNAMETGFLTSSGTSIKSGQQIYELLMLLRYPKKLLSLKRKSQLKKKKTLSKLLELAEHMLNTLLSPKVLLQKLA